MQSRRLTDNIVQLTRMGWVNAYLVREDDGFTLVDTTLGGAADKLIEAARRAGGEIRRIAFTHGHGDHIGSLDALRDRLGAGVEVFLGEADAEIHAGRYPDGRKPPGMWPSVRTAPDVRLHGGERIASLEVVPSPGHTPGHMAFLDTRDRSLIAGDVFTSLGRVAVSSHFTLPFPLAATATWDRSLDVGSARLLRGLEPQLLAVGHGGAVTAPVSRMDGAIASAERARR